MSLTEDISLLVTRANALVTTFETKKTDIETAVSAAIGAISANSKAVFVHAVSGSDANTGAVTAPFMTIDRALEVVKDVPVARIFLLSNARLTKRIQTACRYLEILGATYVPGATNELPDATRTLTFAAEIAPNAGGERQSAGIYQYAGGTITFSNIATVLPNVEAAVVHKAMVGFLTGGALILRGGSLTVENAATTAKFGDVWAPCQLIFGVSSTTISSDALGKVLVGVAAGANPNAVWQYRSNLTSL